MNPERIVRILLILMGVACVPALIPASMPLSWIAGAHEWIGLGKFPEQPIAEYLARGMSALCGFYGGLALVLSRDVMRYLYVIRYQAIFLCIASPLGLLMSLRVGLPAIYPVADTIGALAVLIPILVLSFRLKE